MPATPSARRQRSTFRGRSLRKWAPCLPPATPDKIAPVDGWLRGRAEPAYRLKLPRFFAMAARRSTNYIRNDLAPLRFQRGDSHAHDIFNGDPAQPCVARKSIHRTRTSFAPPQKAPERLAPPGRFCVNTPLLNKSSPGRCLPRTGASWGNERLPALAMTLRAGAGAGRTRSIRTPRPS